MDFHCLTFFNEWKDDFFPEKEVERGELNCLRFGFESQGEVDVCHSTARKLEDLLGSFSENVNISSVKGTF